MKKPLLLNPLRYLFVSVFIISFSVNSQTCFGPVNIIDDSLNMTPSEIIAADINGDGYNDIIVASNYKYNLFWYTNINGEGIFGKSNMISEIAGDVSSVFAADLDGDNDIDIVTAMGCHNKLSWYENLDGNGTFDVKKIITSVISYPLDVIAADIDSDGDLDIISASRYDHRIAWFENDGIGNFGAVNNVSLEIGGARAVCAADIDGDNDLDLVSGAYVDDLVAWHENIDGKGNFGDPQIITTNVDNVMDIFTIDIDGDEDIDVLSASYNDGLIALYKNDGHGSFSQQIVVSSVGGGPATLFSMDLDNDNDADIVTGTIIDDKILWYKNTNGNGSFDEEYIISDYYLGPYSVYVSDLNDDDDPDILTVFYDNDKVAWFQNINLKINEQPKDQVTCLYGNTSFIVSATNAMTFQWQENTGTRFENISNNNIYSGVCSEILEITGADSYMNDNKYRCVISNSCDSVISEICTLSVEDFEPPVIISYPNDHFIDDNTNCEGVIYDYSDSIVAIDNCAGLLEIVQIPIAGSIISGYENKVIIQVYDSSDNFSEISFNVSIFDDTKPVISNAPDNYTLYADENCEGILPDFSNILEISDNCDDSISVIQNPEAGTLIFGDSNLISLSVTDGAENNSIVSFYVSVIDDVKPVIVCIGDTTVVLEGINTSYLIEDSRFDPEVVQDNCDVLSIVNNLNFSETLEGAEFLAGINNVTWTVTDYFNNKTECSQEIIVTSDNEIFIFPNPTLGKAFINPGGHSISKLEIYDMNGKPVAFRDVGDSNEKIDITNLNADVYLLKIYTDTEIILKKIIKKK